tara:strand:- start:3647 stop:4966 length:1320 start_codon:yes stop_codon:yes gene_type:complete
MAYNFKFPDVGEGITEGEVVKIRVKVGDIVKEDDIIAEVETDKAVVQIPSPVSGTILKINYHEGDTIHVGEVFVVIGEKGEHVEKPQKLEEKLESKKKGSVSVVGTLEEAEEPEKEIREARKDLNVVMEKEDSAVIRADKAVGDVLAMPKVRKLAREWGVDVSKVKASGTHGQITEGDLKGAKGESVSGVNKTVKHTRKYDVYGYVERIPLKGVRKTIARNMKTSYSEIPHVTHVDKVDMTKLVEIRAREKKIAEKKGIKLTYLPFIIKSVIAALKEHPYLNSSLEIDGLGEEQIVLKKYHNIGVAVDTPDGLMVPVVKGADKKSILDIAKEIFNLADNARERKLNLGDLKGGTFTITNYGSIGGLYGTPIINYPEAAILGVGRMKDEAVVTNGKVESRKIMYLSLSFDHRILDGAEAAKFMNKLIGFLEDPDSLLIEM